MAGLLSGKSSTYKRRLIVGIDYGTTYSGLSFAMTNAADFKDIYAWTKYPGSSTHDAQHNVKAPSRLAYSHENDELSGDAWGYQVDPFMKSYSWTKLLLDDTALPTEYDDPSLKLKDWQDLMALPVGKTAQNVVADYLRGMFSMFESAMVETYGQGSLDCLPTDFFITVPATWSEKAKMRTLAAAEAAGFGSRPLDRVHVISEPEAAAHAALKTSIYRVNAQVKAGASVLICDCGGGTVDITTYEVLKVDPVLKLRELCVGIGGKCGGTFVDRNLHKLMAERFGAAFTSLDAGLVGPGSEFMCRFERRKKDFSLKDPRQQPARLPLPMSGLPTDREDFPQHYEKRSLSVLLSQDDMKSLFDPVVDKILKMLEDQVMKVSGDERESVQEITLIPVGGFGESPYLRERIAEWCENRAATMRVPVQDSWSCVARGAVLQGLEGSAIYERMCRRHYGTTWSHKYLPEIHEPFDKERRRLWTDHFNGQVLLSGFMSWGINKGTTVSESTEVDLGFWYHFENIDSVQLQHRITLYGCSLDVAPQTLDNDRIEEVGAIAFSLQGFDHSKIDRKTDYSGTQRYRAHFILKMSMADTSGVLRFRILYDGQEAGKAELDFSS